MDALDRKILSLLQGEGRTSTTDLAQQVGLSLSSCHRRLKELERSGAIERYRAVVSPEAVGLGFEALVFVRMEHTGPAVIARFEAMVEQIPQIIEAERLFGEPDFMLRVLVPDLAAYQKFYDTVLSGLPGVQRLNSTLVMKRIGPDREIPV
ncbi:Lrp/AsnC family transcriptional regulator [Kocuria tytonicola]|uniref:Lrp/AsnC family transcriptional regulator n=1 Tax=Kocuria tytonicola TaxID=2055946 RepID=A0A3L9LCP4_9MICC|nr:Lrp/AsnC family transcriptional regulator [Kocuria tytonicola]RLY94172.1 Lrp/AsnC family transcriptional regulator [Kocuria tytonicola]